MAKHFVAVAGLWLLGALVAAAQNADLSLLFTVRNSEVRLARAGNFEARVRSAGISLGGIAAVQLRESGPQRLYFEVPYLDAGTLSATSGPNALTARGPTTIVAPGLRYQYTFTPRWAVYTSLGAGFARYSYTALQITGPASRSVAARDNRFAAGYGAGLSFRLSKLLSLRAEMRHYILAGDVVASRNVFSPAFGMAVHF